MSDSEGGHGYPRAVVWVNAVVSLVITGAIIWWVNGFELFYERLYRISPTVQGGGVGTDFVQGNTIGWLRLLIDFIHLVDFVMAAFILLMVFVHWGAFRRLASRMRRPGETAATDGGRVEEGGERR